MKKRGLLVMPLMAISLLASCGGSEPSANQFTVAFDTDGGSYIESQKVSSGEKVTKPDNPTKEQTDIYTFTFNEWQLDGSTYDFDTPVTKDITLKAVYDKKARHYKANATNKNNLIFTTLDDASLTDIDIIAGQVFKFKVKANNTTNSDHYIVPSILNISIKSMEPLVDGYKVENPGEEVSEVTIDANKVIGDVVISGNAVNDGKFNYQVSSYYGLEKIDSGSASKIDGLTLTFTPESSYTKPKAENIYIYFDAADMWISPADADVSDEYCSYNEESGNLTIKVDHIINNIDIKARANNYKLLDSLTWEKINELSIIGAAPYVFYIGEEKTVNVNTQDHKVRIIGFNQDVDKDDNKIGITFEFANLISDNQGYSLATQWNDTNDLDIANHNYLDSSIRKALTNEGKGHILWAQKGKTAWSTKDEYKKSILEMLPSELTKVLVAPKKTIQFYENGAWIDKPIVNDNGEYDKLFLLSPEEMGNDTARAGAYTYYYEFDNTKFKSLRIKKQIKGTEVYKSSPEIPSGSGQTYQNPVYNNAGYNYSSDESRGGILWLRSPNTSDSHTAWRVNYDGSLKGYIVYWRAYAVSPAFCI